MPLLHGLSNSKMGRALTKSDFAYQRIRERILSGDLQPGEPLDQASIAGALDVSTTPLREALRKLESEGLVVSRAHRDTIVAPLDFAVLEQAWVIRVELEPLGARLACVCASDTELVALASYTRRPPPDKDPLSLMRYNSEVHRQIYRVSHSSTLIKILDSLSDLVDRYRLMTFRSDPGRVQDHRPHDAIISAMIARDSASASTLMQSHIAEGLARVKDAYESF